MASNIWRIVWYKKKERTVRSTTEYSLKILHLVLKKSFYMIFFFNFEKKNYDFDPFNIALLIFPLDCLGMKTWFILSKKKNLV